MSEEIKPLRVPVAAPLTDREVAKSGTYTTDAMLINCYIETSPEGRVFVVKRPGMSSAFTYNGGGATSGQGMFFHQGGLYAMGSNVLYRLSGSANGSADGTAWAASTSAPWTGRSQFGCIVFNGQIFVVGGENTGGTAFLNDVWASTDGVNWTQAVSAAPWAKRRDMGLAVLGKTLFLIGGNGSAQYNDVWSTPDGVNWTQVVGGAPWDALTGHAVVSFNQGIFILGGYKSLLGTESNEVWFSPDGLTWTQQVTTAPWTARHYHSALVYGGKIFVAGGINSGAVQQSVYSSPDGITWTNVGNLPAARELMAACVYADKMWFVGGLDSGIARTTTVWSTTDGASYVATASYGGNALYGAQLVAWRTPTSVSAIHAPTLWLIGGNDGVVGYRKLIYRATLNVALPSSFSIATGGATTDQFKFTTQNAGQFIVFKNTTDAWVLYAGVAQKITSTNYPQSTVPGIANLDDTVYVMDAAGVIYGTNLSDPFTLSSLNFITADYEADLGIAIQKYQNYVVALKSTSLQFFYDAGRYPGSPLLPVISANARIGCASAAFVVPMDNTLVFMARTEQRGNYIAMLNGFTPVKISTPDIDRILDSWLASSGDTAFSVRVNGHDFYVMTIAGRDITLAFDFVEKRWHIWRTGATPAKFRASNYATDGIVDYLQDMALGIVYAVSPVTYQDNGAAITLSATGVKVDGGTNERKFCSSLTVIGDRQASTSPNTASISWSDDDETTFSTPITVDLTAARPRVNRCGSFRRRTHRITHAANNPFRVEAFELNVR